MAYISSGPVNILKYGVNPHGTDGSGNKTKIQAALDDLDLAGGGELYFPPGNYYTEGPLYVGTNTTISGAGWGGAGTTAFDDGSGNAIFSVSNGGSSWTNTASEQVTRGTTICLTNNSSGGNTNNSLFELKSYSHTAGGGVAADKWHSSAVLIRNMCLTSVGNVSFATKAIYFDNTDDNIRPYNPDSIHRIENCKFAYWGGEAVYFLGGGTHTSRDNAVINCDFQSCGKALTIGTTTAYAAIRFEGSSDGIVLGCTIASTGAAGNSAAINTTMAAGIYINGGNIKVYNTKTTFNEGYGVVVGDARAFLIGVESQDDTGGGFLVESSVSDTFMIGCRADSSGTRTTQTVSSINTTSELWTTSANHGLDDGDAIRFASLSTVAVSGTALSTSTTYYIERASDTTFYLHRDQDRTARVNVTTSGSPTFTRLSYGFYVKGSNTSIVGCHATDRDESGRRLSYALRIDSSLTGCNASIAYGTLNIGFTDNTTFGSNPVVNLNAQKSMLPYTETITGSTTLNAATQYVVYNGAGGAGTHVVTLPSVTSASESITISNRSTDKRNILVDASGSETINGLTGNLMMMADQVLTLQNTGTGWHGGAAAAPAAASNIPVREARAFVYQNGGNTYAVRADGTVISFGTTNATNNPTIIQAAINDIAGTATDGHGGGGTVFLSDQNYSVGSYIELKVGVSLVGLGAFDRNATAQGGVPVTPNFHGFYGTTLTPTNTLASFDVNPTGTTLSRNPVILCGRVRYASTTTTNSATSTSLPVTDRTYFPQSGNFAIEVDGNSATVTGGHGTGAGTFTITPSRTWTTGDLVELDQQSTTNPHGIRIIGINIDCRAEPTAQGILIIDSQFVHVLNCNISGAYSSGGKAIEVYSSLAPDEGGHGTRIDGCQIANCYDGIYGTGSGCTDSLITNNRITQYDNDGIFLDHGGWQISGNHITAGSGSRYCVNAAAPSILINNYFDTTGNYHLYIDAICTIQNNIFKAGGGSSQAALIFLTSNGYKSSIIGNVAQLTSTQVGFVKTNNSNNSLSTNASWRAVIANNIIGDNSGSGSAATLTAPVIDSANAAIAESPLAKSFLAPVRLATTTAGTLSTSFANGQSIDGTALVTGDRILIKDQSTSSQNGIYTVNASGSPTRATDADAAGTITYGTAVVVTNGTTNGGTTWACSTTGLITPGTTSHNWARDYGPPLTSASTGANPYIQGNRWHASGW